ncbi:MAG TPA: VOC family protein [bacterium]|nr:VOC family protein [bacterium]
MRLEGIHHITAITADARRNLEFYTGVLGLRLVKKSVNQDDPTAYHLFYGDEDGSAGADLTFFEYPGVERGRTGAGMVHRIVWRVASGTALAFWAGRLRRAGLEVAREGDHLRFDDPEGLGFELRAVETQDAPLVARHPEIPADVALRGFDGVRAYSVEPEGSRTFLEASLGFAAAGSGGFDVRGERRGSFYAYDPAPRRGSGGAGTVHHVAWASRSEDHEAWRERVSRGGGHPTPIIDRFYFRSIYFREPSGVLFEIATIGPGFAVDEPLERLGESLSLPPSLAQLRAELERVLTPLPNPRRSAG